MHFEQISTRNEYMNSLIFKTFLLATETIYVRFILSGFYIKFKLNTPWIITREIFTVTTIDILWFILWKFDILLCTPS